MDRWILIKKYIPQNFIARTIKIDFVKSNKLYSRSLYSQIRPRLRSVDSQTKGFQHHLKFKFARKVSKGLANVTFNITSRVD